MRSGSLTVLVVAPAMPPTVGGAETIAEVLTLGLAERPDMVVHLLTSERPRGPVGRAVEASGGAVAMIGCESGPKDGFVGWEWATFGRAEAVHRICSEHEVDVIHVMSHDAALACAIALEAGLPTRPVVVATFSEMSTEHSEFGRARSAFVYRQAIDGLVHLSHYYRQVAEGYVGGSRHNIVAACVDTELFASGERSRTRAALGAAPARFVILCPSRYSPRKGQLDLLEALHHLSADTIDDVLVVFAGSANSASRDYYEVLEQRAGSTRVETRFVTVPREEMPDYVHACDLVVLPSHLEGLGFAAVEAMAAGRPVLLTDVPGFREIPDGDGQVRFTQAGDPIRLAADLQRLIDDPLLRRQLSTGGRARALAGFAVGPFIDKVVGLYRTCLETPTPEAIAKTCG